MQCNARSQETRVAFQVGVYVFMILTLPCFFSPSGYRWTATAGTGSSLVAAQTTHNITQPFLDDFICNDNASTAAATLIAGNNVAAETLRTWCAADARCADLYGQAGAPDLALFLHLFQTTYPGTVATAALETPLHDLVCNRTSETFLMLGWQLLLKFQLLDSSAVCDVNERPVLNSALGTVSCVCQAGKTCDASSGSTVVMVLVAAFSLLLLVIQFATSMWNQTRLSTVMSNVNGMRSRNRDSVVSNAAFFSVRNNSNHNNSNTNHHPKSGSLASAAGSASDMPALRKRNN